MTPTPQQIEQWRIKAEKWDALDKKILKFYLDADGNELEEGKEGGNLMDIGEVAASAFGYL
jgi:hypothetical protein